MLLDILDMLKVSGNYVGVANTVVHIATLLQNLGETREAIILCEDTLAHRVEHRWATMSPCGLVNLALADPQADVGDLATAREELDTVKGHNRRIYGKLRAQRRTEAVARAQELGLL